MRSFSNWLAAVGRGVRTTESDQVLLDQLRVSRRPGGLLAPEGEEAFTALLVRHGPMVYRVCRRTLRQEAAAEDATQVTFLLLCLKADRVRPDNLPGWLYRVAMRTARRARNQASRGGNPLSGAECVSPAPAPADDLRAVLDEELGRFPPRQQELLLLCLAEGLTQEEAAARLGIPVGTAATWVTRAKRVLLDRLRRRGIGVPAAGLAAALAQSTAGRSPLPAGLVAAAVRAATGGATEPVRALAAGTLQGMTAAKLKAWAVAVVLAAGGAAVTAVGVGADPQGERLAGEVERAKPAPPPPPRAPEPLTRAQVAEVVREQLAGSGYVREQVTVRPGSWEQVLLTQGFSADLLVAVTPEGQGGAVRTYRLTVNNRHPAHAGPAAHVEEVSQVFNGPQDFKVRFKIEQRLPEDHSKFRLLVYVDWERPIPNAGLGVVVQGWVLR